MATLQTLTVNGSTYTIEDPNAARINDSAVGGDAWSSRQILDRLCPAFSQGGEMVSCQPVQLYPLRVVSQIEPVQKVDPSPDSANLITDTSYLNESKWYRASMTDGRSCYVFPLGSDFASGQYCFSGFAGYSISLAFYDEFAGEYKLVADFVGTFKKACQISFNNEFTRHEIALAVLEEDLADNTLGNVISSTASLKLEKGTGNIRSIAGHTGVTLRHSGKNLLKLTGRVPVTMNSFDNTLKRECDGNRVFLGMTNNNYLYSNYIKDYSITDSAVEFTSSSGGYGIGFDVAVKPGQTYSVSFAQQEGTSINISFYRADGTYITSKNSSAGAYSVTAPDNAAWMMVVCRSQTNIPAVFANIQVEHSLAATAYEPYRGEELTADFGQTVYGGSFDWEKGVLTLTHGNIAAYEDEQVPEGWISSTGELSQGAQVVYPLAEPVTVQLQSQEIAAMSGVNTLSSDTGGTAVTGRLDPLPLLQSLIK